MPLDNQSELFYWVDENDQELGSITRKEAHSGSNKIHRAVSIIIENSQGQFLLQKRSQKKDKYPGAWTVAATGHVSYGDEYRETAVKEVKEEVHTDIDASKLKSLGKFLIDGDGEREYVAAFLYKQNSTPASFDKDEVVEIRWVNKSDLKPFVKEHSITPCTKVVFESLHLI